MTATDPLEPLRAALHAAIDSPPSPYSTATLPDGLDPDQAYAATALMHALKDAFRTPKGVVPDSALPFYQPHRYCGG